jgi:hypothetical protein
MDKVLTRTVVRPVVVAVVALQIFLFKAAIMVAQDVPKNVDVDIDVKNPGAGAAWYGNWWVWAIGVAVFLIIIVALTNRGSSSNTVRTE